MHIPAGYELREIVSTDDNVRLARGLRLSDSSAVLMKLPLSDRPDPAILSRLRHEYEIVRRLGSDGILPFQELAKFPGGFALVFGDVDGMPLKAFLAQRKMPLELFFSIALRIVELIGDVHRDKVVHNSISGHSILIQPSTHAMRLMDFHLASVLESETAGRWIAADQPTWLEYISPEQTGRMNRPVDYRTDFYSLGVILYEMLVGWTPFQSDDPMQLIHAHIAKLPAPPHELNPAIPAPVSDIVMKLLEKNAENRYQSHDGIRADLEECRTQWEKSASILAFPLGAQERYDRFLMPQKMYGRAREVAALTDAFDGISRGGIHLVAIAGYSGIGKTRLVQELHPRLTGGNGRYLAGKFDMLQRKIPYFPLTQIFEQFVRSLLVLDDQKLSWWRDRLETKLGANARIAIDLIPELELVLGPRDPVPGLPSAEAETRFRSVVLAFTQAMACVEHPLVMFIDDWQWHDAASLDLLQRLCAHPDTGHLLLICAYRDNEIDLGHPVISAIEAIERSGTAVTRMALKPLTVTNVVSIVADTLHVSDGQEADLGMLIYRKTDGNPFFVGEFLRSLYDKKLLRYNRAMNRWSWNIEEIVRENITDNVAALMTARIQTLPADTQQIVQLAACIGNTVPLATLATIGEETPGNAARRLWPAIEAGLILPSDTSYRSYQFDQSEDIPIEQLLLRAKTTEFRFLHDRVQQAAYASIPAERRNQVHLQIGRLLNKRSSPSRSDETVFEVVNHFNMAAGLIEDDSERVAVASLNLQAARHARLSGSYEDAYGYCRSGQAVSGAVAPTDGMALHAELLHELGICEYLTGRHAEAEAHLDEVLAITLDPVRKARIFCSKIEVYTHLTRFRDALAVASEGLRLLGYSMHPDPGKAHVGRKMAAILWRLRGKDVAALKSLPDMTDPRAIMAIDLLVSLISVAYFHSNEMYALLIITMMEIVLENGVTDSSAFVFGQFAAILGAGLGRYPRAVEFGLLAEELTGRFPHPLWTGRVYLTLGVFTHKWHRPLGEIMPLLHEGYRLAIQSGDYLYAIWLNRYKVATMVFSGEPLQDVRPLIDSGLRFASRIDYAEGSLTAFEYFCDGLTVQPETTAGETYGQDALARIDAMMHENKDSTSRMIHRTNRILTAWLLGESEGATELVNATQEERQGSFGQMLETQHAFVASLFLCTLHRAFPDRRKGIGTRIFRHRKKLRTLARLYPKNYRHYVALIDAECASLRDQRLLAMRLYDDAVSSAQTFGTPMFIAIANECAGRFYCRNSQLHVGHVYLRDALHAYRQWGAIRKAALLEHEFPELIPDTAGRSAPVREEALSTRLDAMTIANAFHAFSSEIVLEKLLRKLITLTLENAGAEAGFLVLDSAHQLRIEAEGGNHLPEISVLQGLPFNESDRISHGIVRFVERTRQPLVLENAHALGAFTDDPVVSARKSRSILCLPLLFASKLTGMLYLENNLLEGAFTPERIDVLQILSAEMAAAIENARLYADLGTAKRQIEEYNRTLEQKVTERTIDLRVKSEELERTIANLHTTQQQLIHSEKLASLGQLTAGIAHEIKNPLNFINNFAALSAELADEMHELYEGSGAVAENDQRSEIIELIEALKCNAQKISEHGRRADAIVRNMMMHAQMGFGERQHTNINVLLDDSIDLAYSSLHALDPSYIVRIVKDYDPGEPGLSVSPQELAQVFRNIIDNAMYAVREKWGQTPSSRQDQRGDPRPLPGLEGGAEEGSVIHISTRSVPGGVEIRIRDNGPGIPDEIMSEIFQPFFTTKPTGEGTGLGLSMSYDIIVKGHGGTIACNSSADGAEFIISLPGTR